LHNVDVHMEFEKEINKETSRSVDILNSILFNPENISDIKYEIK